MKIGIVGAGKVGCACALAAVARGSARTMVIVDRTRKRAEAVVADLCYGAPLCPKTTVIDLDYENLASSELVMITSTKRPVGPSTATTPRAGCGYSIPTPRSIATSFRALCGRRLER